MGVSGRSYSLRSTVFATLTVSCLMTVSVCALGQYSDVRRVEVTEPYDIPETAPSLPGCSVLDCGAFGRGIGDDTEAFKLCWNACSTVTVPAGDYLVAQLDLSGTDKVLKLLDGARLLAPGPDSRQMYGRVFEDWYTVVLKDCTRCAIVGEGNATIDGRSHLWVEGMIPVRLYELL